MFCFFSCGHEEEDSDFVTYYQYGISYKLPKNFELKRIPNTDLNYTDGEAKFFFNAFGEEEMTQDLGISTDMTVKSYTEFFLILNPYTDDYEYDEDRDASSFHYIYDYESDQMENEYYRYLITRNEDTLFVAVVSCDESDVEKYSSVFDEIMNSVTVDKIQ